jgi:hypothetical protein
VFPSQTHLCIEQVNQMFSTLAYSILLNLPLWLFPKTSICIFSKRVFFQKHISFPNSNIGLGQNLFLRREHKFHLYSNLIKVSKSGF